MILAVNKYMIDFLQSSISFRSDAMDLLSGCPIVSDFCSSEKPITSLSNLLSNEVYIGMALNCSMSRELGNFLQFFPRSAEGQQAGTAATFLQFISSRFNISLIIHNGVCVESLRSHVRSRSSGASLGALFPGAIKDARI